jgi:hypothetical protein
MHRIGRQEILKRLANQNLETKSQKINKKNEVVKAKDICLSK